MTDDKRPIKKAKKVKETDGLNWAGTLGENFTMYKLAKKADESAVVARQKNTEQIIMRKLREVHLQYAETKTLDTITKDEGVTPMEVMLDTMRHYADTYKKLEAAAEKLDSEDDEEFRLKQRMLADADTNRQLAIEVAGKVAPYYHPRLSTTVVKSASVKRIIFDSSDDKTPKVEVLNNGD